MCRSCIWRLQTCDGFCCFFGGGVSATAWNVSKKDGDIPFRKLESLFFFFRSPWRSTNIQEKLAHLNTGKHYYSAGVYVI